MTVEEIEKQIPKQVVKDFKKSFYTEKIFIVIMIIEFICFFLCVLMQVAFLGEKISKILAICVFLLIVFTYITFVVVSKKGNKDYKQKIVPLFLNSIFENASYSSNDRISAQAIKDTGILARRSYNRDKGEDFISGQYNGINFCQSDVCLQQVTSNGKSTTVTTIFDGRWMVFDFDKKFKTNMVVYERNMLLAPAKSYNDVVTESKLFNDKFLVKSESELYAFYILTPHYMEKLLSFEANHKGDFFFLFKDNQLHIGINKISDTFKTPKMKEVNIKSVIQSWLDDMNLVKQIIDDFEIEDKAFENA